MKPVLSILFIFSFYFTFAQSGDIGIFDGNTDIGNPQKAGSVTYDEAAQIYTIKGAGDNIWFDRDEFHYLYKNLSGDFILTAQFDFVNDEGDPRRKIGWMVRQSLQPNTSHISALMQGDGLTGLQWRALPGAFMRNPEDEIPAPKDGYSILQLERNGSTFIMRAAHPGEPLQMIGSHEMEDLPDEVFAGLFITSVNESVVEAAKVQNVRIDKPIQSTLSADNEQTVGSRLETMNVMTGQRKIVHESPQRLMFPNWMPNDEKLLFNIDGSLYTIALTGGEPQPFPTGELDGNHNDHGISPDGETLAFTSSEAGISPRVYVTPLDGSGTPRQITEQSPSYWHGWSANGKEVYYVAQRDTNLYFIYKTPLKGGDEVQLTSAEDGYCDGPEGSPDGKYIYYNSNKSGTMQLWRMNTDGSGKERLTYDEYNDWFPHISPDGKWIAFLSYNADVPSDAHPYYERVMVRLMPASGGSPRVVAYLYGGQGTLNVPSWSPDSQEIAIVSYTGMESEELTTSTQ